jgi:hypothetical protein
MSDTAHQPAGHVTAEHLRPGLPGQQESAVLPTSASASPGRWSGAEPGRESQAVGRIRAARRDTGVELREC